MTDFDRSPDGLAFSSAVQAVQRKLGSRRLFEGAGWPIDISRDLEAFITAQRSAFLASASAEGQPNVQHRGGPPIGHLRLLPGLGALGLTNRTMPLWVSGLGRFWAAEVGLCADRASGGRGSAVEPPPSGHVVGHVGQRDRRRGAGDADGPDRHAHPRLLMREDMLDFGAQR